VIKKEDISKAEDFPGIRRQNACYKIYVKILMEKLVGIAEEKMLEHQNGFRKGRSSSP